MAKSYITHNALVNLCPLENRHWHKKEKLEKTAIKNSLIRFFLLDLRFNLQMIIIKEFDLIQNGNFTWLISLLYQLPSKRTSNHALFIEGTVICNVYFAKFQGYGGSAGNFTPKTK